MKSSFPEYPRAAVLTLGCRVNQYESDVIAGELEAAGFDVVPFGEPCDVTVVNTCTVTSESDRKSRQYIRRAAAASPGAPIIVTGCFAQVSPEAAAGLPGVSAVIGNARKADIAALARELTAEHAPARPRMELSDMQSADYDGLMLAHPRRARAYIKIEDGCENRCSYCIIPMARGRVRSKDPRLVVQEAEALARAGCGEIILTGIETAAYGRDAGGAFSLSSLLERLNGIPGIRRIGMGSLDPSLLRGDFLDAVSSLPSVLPHFHLSLQSGSSSVLRRMRRPYNAGQARERMDALRLARPERMLTADVIVGFPGETEAEFEETMQFCREGRFLHLHIFPYSVRSGTEAAEMPGQLPEAEKRRRAAALAAQQAETKRTLLEEYVRAHDTTPVSLLIEEEKNGGSVGHSEHYAEIRTETVCGAPGDIVPVVLRETDGEICRAVPLPVGGK